MGAHHGHHHAHGHAHRHAHGHDHDHHATDHYGRAFGLGVLLNLAFVVVEAGFGFVAGSLALIADAGHNLSDVVGLLIAWGAFALGKVPPSARFTYGLRASSILAALINGALLMLAAGAIALSAIQRLMEPEPAHGVLMMAVAAAGILVNGGTALLFLSGSKGDINIRGAFLHMAADAVVSLGVVLAGLGIWATGRLWIDPVMSLVIVAVIAWGSWGLLREATALSLGGVPNGIDPAAVERYLAGLDGVTAVHDLHIWPMSTTETAMTAHLVIPGGTADDALLHRVAEDVAERFGIGHATVQIEHGGNPCRLEPREVV